MVEKAAPSLQPTARSSQGSCRPVRPRGVLIPSREASEKVASSRHQHSGLQWLAGSVGALFPGSASWDCGCAPATSGPCGALASPSWDCRAASVRLGKQGTEGDQGPWPPWSPAGVHAWLPLVPSSSLPPSAGHAGTTFPAGSTPKPVGPRSRGWQCP